MEEKIPEFEFPDFAFAPRNFISDKYDAFSFTEVNEQRFKKFLTDHKYELPALISIDDMTSFADREYLCIGAYFIDTTFMDVAVPTIDIIVPTELRIDDCNVSIDISKDKIIQGKFYPLMTHRYGQWDLFCDLKQQCVKLGYSYNPMCICPGGTTEDKFCVFIKKLCN